MSFMEPTDIYYLSQKENIQLAKELSLSKKEQLLLLKKRKIGLLSEDWVGMALAKNPSLHKDVALEMFKEILFDEPKYFDLFPFNNLLKNSSLNITGRVNMHREIHKQKNIFKKENPDRSVTVRFPVLRDDHYFIETLAPLVEKVEDQRYIFEFLFVDDEIQENSFIAFCLNKNLDPEIEKELRDYICFGDISYKTQESALYNLDIQRHKSQEQLEEDRAKSAKSNQEILDLFAKE